MAMEMAPAVIHLKEVSTGPHGGATGGSLWRSLQHDFVYARWNKTRCLVHLCLGDSRLGSARHPVAVEANGPGLELA